MGVLALVIVVGCVFWASAIDSVGFHERGNVLNWSRMPTTISLFTFYYVGHVSFSYTLYFHEGQKPIFQGKK